MSNNKTMESKITIHTAEDYKPVIKVIEKESDDVRDKLIRSFRQLLNHQSRTFTINFIPTEGDVLSGYHIVPVTDEIEYFRESLLSEITMDRSSIGAIKDLIITLEKAIEFQEKGITTG